jgi:hypothetical protein
MSFSATLYRNPNLANRLTGLFPLGNGSTDDTDTLIHVFYGQSNTYGSRAFDSGAVDDAVNQDPDSIRMLNSNFDGLVSAAELVSNSAMASWSKLTSEDTSGLISYANYMYDRLPNNPQVVMLNGSPGTVLDGMSSGTSPFSLWQTQFDATVGLLQAEGKTARVDHIIYVQGESDILHNNEDGWADRLNNNVYVPMVAHIKSQTGQTNDPVMLVTVISSMYTLNYNDLALEMMRANSVNPNIKVSAYSGFIDHHTDAQHYTGQGQRHLMQMQAKFSYYSELEALQVTSAEVQGSTIELQVSGGEGDLKVTLPIGMSSAPVDHNFRVFDDGITPISVTNVTLDNINRKIVLELADSGSGINYTVDGSYYTTNALHPDNTGGQYNTGRVPITDSDPRKGNLNDSQNHGNPDLFNALMPFRITGVN